MPPALQPQALAALALFTQLGCLHLVGGSPGWLQLPPLPAAAVAAAAATEPEPLQALQAQRQAVATARRALHDGALADASAALRALPGPPGSWPVEAQAYMSLTCALGGDAEMAHTLAQGALRRAPQDGLAHAAAARAHALAGRQAQAAYHHKMALGSAQNNAAWYAEIQQALGLQSAALRVAAKAAPRDGRALALGTLALAVVLGCFGAAMAPRLGADEYLYRGDDPLFYGRRLTLLVCGLVGMCVWAGRSPWGLARALPWRLPPGWAPRIVAYGAVVGLLSPLQRVTGAPPVVLALAAMHVLCEDVFFQGLVSRLLLDLVPHRRLAALLSGIFYAAYHCTYYSFWVESGWQPRLFYVGLIAAFAGVPYAWLLGRTGSLLAPLLCHLAVQLSMMGLSLARLAG